MMTLFINYSNKKQDSFESTCIAYRILIDNIYYNCFYRKKGFEIKTDKKKLFKMNIVTRKIKWISCTIYWK